MIIVSFLLTGIYYYYKEIKDNENINFISYEVYLLRMKYKNNEKAYNLLLQKFRLIEESEEYSIKINYINDIEKGLGSIFSEEDNYKFVNSLSIKKAVFRKIS